ncbi:MAG: carbohydrate porin [Gammaproteobacteria bacterium]|nr:carbohydrate porin [Gammaproteobacteria bacterium]
MTTISSTFCHDRQNLSARLFLGCILACAGAGTGAAESTDASAIYGEIAINQRQAQRRLKSGHDLLQPLTDAFSGYFAWKDRLREDYGFSYTVEYSPQAQWDLRLNGLHTSNDETNLIFQWAAVDRADMKRGTLMGWYQVSRTLGSRHTSQFMQDVGIITPTNGGDTAPGDYNDLWQMLSWEQWFLDDTLRFGIGKLTTRTFLNLNRYAVGDREDFLTPQLVNNTVVPFTARNGMGLFGQYHMDEAYLTGMVREADGTSTDISFDTLDSGKWEYAVELGLTPTNTAGLGEGIYRFTGYYTDSIGTGANKQPSGWAMALSFDQDIGNDYGAFFRYSYAGEDWRAFRQRIGAGVQIKHPLGFRYDRIGLAAWWAEPTNNTLSGETGVETFWKLQLAPNIEVTPDLQLIFNPQGNMNRNHVLIGSLRLRVLM